MVKKQLIVLGGALVAVGILFSLPRVVVDNEEGGISERASTATADVSSTEEENAHLPTLTAAARLEADSLRALYEANESIEKNTIFANSLIELFAQAGRYDSAAYYAEALAEQTNTVAAQKKAGEMYYEAFMMAMSAEQSRRLGEKTRIYFDKVLAVQPDNLDAKAKAAMTYVSSSTPMQGIQMLREVVEEDENHELATYNLGLLSMQSGQYDKAVERLEKVKEINPDNIQAQFLLGVSYLEAGEADKARAQFEHLKEISDDPEIIANVDNYLERI
uniref:Tetratricopeptide repeat protein n=1 Tax=Roseihalotalea indica TaxID=2867963 RepID=A0AA49JHG0_9BACT|nr:tetratricopeptide repeat protein [Tunicatimonas sp. TK19036]